MSERHLTTGEAAEFCSVTRDTIFKWIRAGHLPAHRTAGGHHRIDRGDLERFVTGSEKLDADPQPQEGVPQFRYCWQYHGHGSILEGCRRCGVYRMRAKRCYELLRLAPEVKEAGIFCKESCGDCDYYRVVHRQNTNVLILSDDPELVAGLTADAEEVGFSLQIANCGYDCSTLVDHFRPDFIVIDCCLGRKEAKSIVQHLVRDPRIPFVRLVIAGQEGEFSSECDEGVFGRINRPFSLQDISEFISPAASESLDVSESQSEM